MLAIPTLIGLKLLYRIENGWLPVLGIGLVLFFLLLGRERRRKEKEDGRFEACADYLQQMLFAFEKTREITLALQETAGLFPKGDMHEVLERALQFLEKTYTGNSEEDALYMVERGYPTEEVKILHAFMLEAQRQGGEIEDAVAVLKEEHRRYRTRINLFQEQCRKQRRNILLACIAGMLLCSSILYLVPDGSMLTDYPLYHIGTVFLIILNFTIMYLGIHITAKDWLKEEKAYSNEEVEEKLLRYLNRKQRLGRRTLKRILDKEVEKAFPGWMLTMTLLLQNRDVAGAIAQSAKDRSPILHYYIRRMLSELKEKPDSPEPYMNFLGEFAKPETTTFMKLLFAISSGGCKDAPKQLSALLERSNQMAEQAVVLKQENSVAWMQALFMMPTLLASFKLILDMSMLLVSFLSRLGMA